MARRGEELGFGFATVSDHVVIPGTVQSRHPYSVAGVYPGGVEQLELVALLSFLAAHTTTLRLMSGVMVLPHRGPILAAKMLATIDVLSQGRLIVGCGVGWLREEFEALGAPRYEDRGAVGDEYILAFKELWTSDEPRFEGAHVSFSDLTFAPKPVQKPHPPIWVGGGSPPALRRAARLGDGWYPFGINTEHPMSTATELAEYIAKLHRLAEKAGRDPADIAVAYSAGWAEEGEETDGLPVRGVRPPFSGSAEQVAQDIRDFEEIGVGHMKFDIKRETLSESLERLDRFASEVMPLV